MTSRLSKRKEIDHVYEMVRVLSLVFAIADSEVREESIFYSLMEKELWAIDFSSILVMRSSREGWKEKFYYRIQEQFLSCTCAIWALGESRRTPTWYKHHLADMQSLVGRLVAIRSYIPWGLHTYWLRSDVAESELLRCLSVFDNFWSRTSDLAHSHEVMEFMWSYMRSHIPRVVLNALHLHRPSYVTSPTTSTLSGLKTYLVIITMSRNLVAVVTGSNRGIGNAICQTLASHNGPKPLVIYATSRSGDDLAIKARWVTFPYALSCYLIRAFLG